MPENGGFPCGINAIRVFVTDVARSTPSGQGERQTAKGRLVARIPNSQEGHRVTRRVPNSHGGTDNSQKSTEWLRVCLESWQMFCAWFPSFIFWTFNAIFGHLCQFLPPGMTKIFYVDKNQLCLPVPGLTAFYRQFLAGAKRASISSQLRTPPSSEQIIIHLDHEEGIPVSFADGRCPQDAKSTFGPCQISIQNKVTFHGSVVFFYFRCWYQEQNYLNLENKIWSPMLKNAYPCDYIMQI